MPARILIVEDEAVVAMELGLLLEDLGHEIVGYAPDSVRALTEADQVEVDLALVDVHLSDGPTGGRLGAVLARRGVSVLYLTANPTMVLDQAESGPLGVLPKPTD